MSVDHFEMITKLYKLIYRYCHKMAKDTASKANMRSLRRKSKYHNVELKKLHNQESKILKNEGYEERSHVLIWLLIIVAIVVAVVWFLFVRT